MVMIEGRGVVSPAPVAVNVDRHVRIVLSMEAERRAAHRRYYERHDSWGRGLLPSADGVSKAASPILVGCIGEWAFATYVNARIGKRIAETDLSLNPHGDFGNDFVIANQRYQLKTRRKRTGANYVRRISESKRICGLTIGRYVFAQWNWSEERCLLLGWCTHNALRSCRMELSPVAGHRNLVVPESLLRPMDRLVTDIRADIQMESMAWH